MPKAKLWRLCLDVTASLMSPDNSDSSSVASKASTPHAGSEGSADDSGPDSDGDVVLVATRNVGDS